MNRRVENISINTDEILSQDQLKTKLVYLKDLFDDLKVVKLGNVKDCIMKEVFQTLGSVEKTADQLYDVISRADSAIDKLEYAIAKQRRLHELQISKIIEAHHEELNDIEITDEDRKFDQQLAEFQKNTGYVSTGPEIPKEEQDCYTKWLEGSTLESAVSADDDTHQLTMDEILGSVDKATLALDSQSNADSGLSEQSDLSSEGNKKQRKRSSKSKKAKHQKKEDGTNESK